MFTKKFIIIMSAAIGLLLIFIAGLLLWKNFSTPKSAIQSSGKIVEVDEAPQSSIEAGQSTTEDIIKETKKLAAGNDLDKIAQVITVTRTDGNGSSTQEQAVIVAPQSNPISIETGEVLTRDGTAAANESGRSGDPNTTLQSAPIDPNKLPAGSIKLSITPTAITPAEFTVKAGQLVVLAISSGASIEVFKFDSPALSAVAVGLEPHQTLAINFNAPLKIGEYVFYSDFAGHRRAGAIGKMIVE
jgi:hypothetical protein